MTQKVFKCRKTHLDNAGSVLLRPVPVTQLDTFPRCCVEACAGFCIHEKLVGKTCVRRRKEARTRVEVIVPVDTNPRYVLASRSVKKNLYKICLIVWIQLLQFRVRVLKCNMRVTIFYYTYYKFRFSFRNFSPNKTSLETWKELKQERKDSIQKV